MRTKIWLAAVAWGMLVLPQIVMGDNDASRRQIEELGQAYVAAVNARDAQKVAGFWSPDAVYTNRATGDEVVGREAIQKQFAAQFESAPDGKIAIDIESIQFVSPNVALEYGEAQFVQAEGEPQRVPYSAVYVRRDGKWLLDRVTDEDTSESASHYDKLKTLEWLVGSWVDQDESAMIQTDCEWTTNRNFLTRKFRVSVDGLVELSGLQIIGWDAGAEQIRSWTFDSDGGFAEGSWTNDGDRWFVRKVGTTAAGAKATAVNVLRYVDNDTLTVQSIQRTLDGRILPNIDEVQVVRQ